MSTRDSLAVARPRVGRRAIGALAVALCLACVAPALAASDADPASLSDDQSYSLLRDRSGLLWAAGACISTTRTPDGGAITREVDVAARLGGDEFAILLEGTAEPEAIGPVCQRILASFGAPVTVEDRIVQVGISMGCAVYPRDGLTQSELYRVADQALYAAKAAGRNTWRMYDRIHKRESGPNRPPALTRAG